MVVSAAVLYAGAVVAVDAQPATAAVATCSDVHIPVNVPEPAQLAGTVCLPARGSSVLQVLVPGASYTRSYWMWPTHDYAAAANTAGYATFALDRLSTGTSTQLNPLTTTVTTNATAIHQAIGRLRNRYHFDRVVLVGHSLGSVTVVRENGLYPSDASAVVVSGYARWISLGFTEALLRPGVLVPAPLSGRSTLGDRAAGNLTITDPVRTEMFNASGDYDPAVAAADNRSKDTFTIGETLEGFPEGDIPLLGAHTVTAPVLVALGGKDATLSCSFTGFCNNTTDLVSKERSAFDNARSVDGYILPGAGHDINLANNSSQWFDYAQRWIGIHTRK